MPHISSPNPSEAVTGRWRSTHPGSRAALCCTLTLCLMLCVTACKLSKEPDSATPPMTPAKEEPAPQDAPPAEDAPKLKIEGESPTRIEPDAAPPEEHGEDKEGSQAPQQDDDAQKPGLDDIGKFGSGEDNEDGSSKPSPSPSPRPTRHGADHDMGGPQGGGVNGDLASPDGNKRRQSKSKKSDPNYREEFGVEGKDKPSRSKKSQGYREEFGIE